MKIFLVYKDAVSSRVKALEKKIKSWVCHIIL